MVVENKNKGVQRLTKQAILEIVGEEVLTTEQLIDKLFQSNVMSEKNCKIALIRRRFYELLSTNPKMNQTEARFICEDEFDAPETFVKNAIYRWRKVDFTDGF